MSIELKNRVLSRVSADNPPENQDKPVNIEKFLQLINAQVYDGLKGLDRQEVVGSLVRNFTEEWKKQLREIVTSFLYKMIELDASDIDFGGGGCGEKVWLRVHGQKKPFAELGKFTLEHSDILIQNLLSEKQRDYLFSKRNLDFSYQILKNSKRYRFRANIYFDLDNLAINMRYIPNEIRPFKELGLHPEVAGVLNLETNKQGLTLVTGITGSGKSSTLDSIVDANNKSIDAHIVIIGAPVETVHDPKRCIIRHREVGRDVLSFKEGAVQSLRQDPDIIIIGEMRDPDTIITTLEITDSGHKVFSTLHTASAVESIDRIVGETPPEEQERVRLRLADTLNCIISQKLVPDVKGTRILVKEIMLVTSSVRAAIRNGNISEIYQMVFEGRELGMLTMEQDLFRKVRNGLIETETAMHFANNKKRMSELLGNK